MAARRKFIEKSTTRKKNNLQTPGAGKRGTVAQADSMLRWWKIHCKEVPRSNKLLISDIGEMARLLKWVKGLEAKESLKGTEKAHLARTKRMLRATLTDIAAEMRKLEYGTSSFDWDPLVNQPS